MVYNTVCLFYTFYLITLPLLSLHPGIYLTVTMAMTSMSVIFSVFVLHVHHRGSLCRRAPGWLRRTALTLSRFVCHQATPLLSAKLGPSCGDPSAGSSRRAPQSPRRRILRAGYGSFNQGFRMSSLRNVTLKAMENGEYSIQQTSGGGGQSQPPGSGESNSCSLEQLALRRMKQTEEEMLLQLRTIIDCYHREEREVKINREWADIAIVFDRALFWFMFVLATTVTLSLLIFKPLTKSVSIDDYL